MNVFALPGDNPADSAKQFLARLRPGMRREFDRIVAAGGTDETLCYCTLLSWLALERRGLVHLTSVASTGVTVARISLAGAHLHQLRQGRIYPDERAA